METVAKRSDSFDRFCDDLCEYILKYLSIDQKLKFECVSKQWQRNVFQTQYALDLNYLTDWLGNYDHYLPPIECLFKKCSLISHISCNFEKLAEDFGKFMPRKVFRKIADNCENLRSIRFEKYKFENYYIPGITITADDIPYEECAHFFKTRGQTLRRVAYDERMPNYHYRLILRYCPHLLAIDCPRIDLRGRRPFEKEYVLVTKLEEIGTLHVSNDNEIIVFNVFMSQCANTIKALRVDFTVTSDTVTILAQISNLINLVKLDLRFSSHFDTHTCGDGFKQISAKCRKLSHLKLKVCQLTVEGIETLNHCLKDFTQITDLKLDIYEEFEFSKHNQFLIPHSLMYCKRLTNICLDIRFTDTTFNNLHSIMPQIKVIRLTGFCKNIITDITIKCLAKLKQLNVLDLLSCDAKLTGITDEGIRDILDNCLHFRSFKFKRMPNITVKTIDKLIEVAINRPQVGFTHQIDCFVEDLDKPIVKSIIERENNYPKNLEIKLFSVRMLMSNFKIQKSKLIVTRFRI